MRAYGMTADPTRRPLLSGRPQASSQGPFVLLLLSTILFLQAPAEVSGQENDLCLMCHDDIGSRACPTLPTWW